MINTVSWYWPSWLAKAIAVVACLLAVGLCAHASDAAAPAVPGPTEKPLTVPLEVSAPVAPAVFNSGGQTHLAYELRVTNVGPWNCVIAGLDVVVANGGSHPLASFSQADIERMTPRSVMPKVATRAGSVGHHVCLGHA